MDKDLKSNIYYKLESISRFLGQPLVQIVLALISAFGGFFVSELLQKENIASIEKVLNEMSKIDSNVNYEQVNKVIESFFSPFSVISFIYAILCAFFSIVITNMIASCSPHKETKGEDWNSENIIVDLLNHLTEQVYSRCSSVSEHCGQCGKFASEDDGLLRLYLYEESRHLQKSIMKSRNGEYSLDNNIPKFHTFAITHMLHTYGEQYSVIQWIGSSPYTDQNKYDETYDALDFDFLYTLLQKVTEPIYGRNKSNPYYMTKQSGKITFKIKWLLIGNVECMKNNFDYIFYVINQLSKDNGIAIDEEMNIISSFFEFYRISEDNYNRQIEIILRNYSSDYCKELFYLDNKPSFGIFGDQFMFVDALNRASHGSIYTRKYTPDGGNQSLLDSTIDIYNRILGISDRLNISNLFNLYDEILKMDKEWENQLESIWQKKIGGL